MGTRIFAGHRTRPPALGDTSPLCHARRNQGTDSYRMSATIGSRKTTVPKMSIHVCVRREKRPAITSMRMCSFLSSVYAAHSRKIAENRYHWTSRKALELMSKALRTMALAALMNTATRTSQ